MNLDEFLSENTLKKRQKKEDSNDTNKQKGNNTGANKGGNGNKNGAGGAGNKNGGGGAAGVKKTTPKQAATKQAQPQPKPKPTPVKKPTPSTVKQEPVKTVDPVPFPVVTQTLFQPIVVTTTTTKAKKTTKIDTVTATPSNIIPSTTNNYNLIDNGKNRSIDKRFTTGVFAGLGLFVLAVGLFIFGTKKYSKRKDRPHYLTRKVENTKKTLNITPEPSPLLNAPSIREHRNSFTPSYIASQNLSPPQATYGVYDNASYNSENSYYSNAAVAPTATAANQSFNQAYQTDVNTPTINISPAYDHLDYQAQAAMSPALSPVISPVMSPVMSPVISPTSLSPAESYQQTYNNLYANYTNYNYNYGYTYDYGYDANNLSPISATATGTLPYTMNSTNTKVVRHASISRGTQTSPPLDKSATTTGDESENTTSTNTNTSETSEIEDRTDKSGNYENENIKITSQDNSNAATTTTTTTITTTTNNNNNNDNNNNNNNNNENKESTSPKGNESQPNIVVSPPNTNIQNVNPINTHTTVVAPQRGESRLAYPAPVYFYNGSPEIQSINPILPEIVNGSPLAVPIVPEIDEVTINGSVGIPSLLSSNKALSKSPSVHESGLTHDELLLNIGIKPRPRPISLPPYQQQVLNMISPEMDNQVVYHQRPISYQPPVNMHPSSNIYIPPVIAITPPPPPQKSHEIEVNGTYDNNNNNNQEEPKIEITSAEKPKNEVVKTEEPIIKITNAEETKDEELKVEVKKEDDSKTQEQKTN